MNLWSSLLKINIWKTDGTLFHVGQFDVNKAGMCGRRVYICTVPGVHLFLLFIVKETNMAQIWSKKYFRCRFTKLRLAYLTHSLTVILLTVIKWGRNHMRALTFCERNHFCCKVCHMWTCCCIGLKFWDVFRAKLSDYDQIPHRIMGDKTLESPYMASNRKIFTYLWLVHVNLYVHLGCPFGTKFYNFMLPLQLKIHTHSNARLNTACDPNTHV